MMYKNPNIFTLVQSNQHKCVFSVACWHWQNKFSYCNFLFFFNITAIILWSEKQTKHVKAASST